MIVRFLFASGLLAVAAGHAAEPAPKSATAFSAERLALIDRPFLGENITLSPDGKHLAFTKYEDAKLNLIVVDFATKTQKVVLLQDDSSTKSHRPRLAELRWASARWLVLVSLDGEIMALDIETQKPVLLWEKGDDGLLEAANLRREHYNISAGVPRLLPAVIGDSDHLLIETAAEIGADRLANVYRVAVASGEKKVPDRLYLAWQVALYGRGDMLLWPPLSPDVLRWVRNPSASGGLDGSLRNVGQYFDGDGPSHPAPIYDIRRKLEMFLLNPPTVEAIVGGQEGINYHGWPGSPAGALVSPPFADQISPTTGGAVSADSSSTGQMIYDRQGWPRLLYTEDTFGAPRKWLLFDANTRIFEPNIPPRDLNYRLGQPKSHEFEINPGNFFGERAYPIAFDYDPDVLYYASNVGRDTFGIFSLNLKTKERKPVAAPESAPFDLAPLEPDYDHTNLVFDDQARRLVGIRFNGLHPSTVWLDPEINTIQQELAASYPKYNVEILNWSDDRQHFLARIASAEDPGAYVVSHRADHSVDVALQRAPWLKDTIVHASSAIAFQTPAGTKLIGWLTLPTTPKLSPPPLLIYCQGGLWDGDTPSFSREAQILADLGIAVMRVNYRGTAGRGRAHLNALLEGIDSVPLDDILASIDWISARYKIDRRRIILMGEGFGGYLALRGLQLHPDVFRCGISINAPTSLTAWASWKPMSTPRPLYIRGESEMAIPIDFNSLVRGALVKNAKQARSASGAEGRALLVIESSGNQDTTPFASLLGGLGLGAGGADIERLGLNGPFVDGSLATRTRAFQRIEEFLTFNLYDFSSSIGELKVLDEAVSPAKK